MLVWREQGRNGNVLLICAQQCRNLFILNLSLEDILIWLNFCFVALKFVVSVQAPRTRAVKNVRRHACSSIIKMCRDYPQLVLVCKCSCCEVSCLSFSWILWDLQPPWLQSLLSSQETFLLHKQQSGSFPVPLFFPAEKFSA